MSENEILKSKIADLETQMSTLSGVESELQEVRSREKMEYERRIADLVEEKGRLGEELRIRE